MAVWNPWIAVMTEHALVVNYPRGALIIGAVVAWIHRPIAAFFRIPAQRQLLQSVAACEMEIGPRGVSGTQHEINLLLLHIGFLAVKTKFPATLIIFAAPV